MNEISPALRPDDSAVRQGRRAALVARFFDVGVLVFLIALALRHYNFAVEKHYAFGHNTVEDKAIFNHLLWNLSHHLSWQNTVLYYTDNFLCNHFSPIYLPLSFIYALWPTPEMCWLMIDAGLAGGMFLLYLLAAARLGGEGQPAWRRIVARAGAFFMVTMFVAHPVMASNLFVAGWRDTALAVCFLCLALWGWERERFRWFVAGFVLAAMCKEDIPFIGIGFSALAFLQRREWRWKVFPVWFGIAYAILAFATMRQIGEIWEAQDLSRYAYLGKPGPDALWNMVVHPGLWAHQVFSPAKISAMRDLFGPLGYLSLLGPEFLIAPVSQFAEVLLADQSYIPQPGYWYVTPTVPFVFYAAVVGVSRLMRLAESVAGRLARLSGRLAGWLTPGRLTAWVAVATTLMLGIAAWEPLACETAPLAAWRSWLILHREDVRREEVRSLLAAIPPGARVCAQDKFTLALSSRRHIYCLPVMLDAAEYVVVNPNDNFWPASREQFGEILEALDNPRAFRLAYQRGETRVYARIPAGPKLAPSPDEGLTGRFYEMGEPVWWLPDYSGRAANREGRFRVMDFPFTEGELVATDGTRTGCSELFVAVFSGSILLEKGGRYVFTVESDDGFRLSIDGKEAGEHAGVRAFAGTDMVVTLAEGAHSLRLEYFNNGRPGGLRFLWTPPGRKRGVVPAEVLRREGAEDIR